MSDKGLFMATLLAAVVAAVLVYLPDPEFQNVSPAGSSDTCAPDSVYRVPRFPSRNEKTGRLFIVNKPEDWRTGQIFATDTIQKR
jgi:hypothetical protein